MAELVTIPISFFELTVDYERPALKIWGDRAAIVQAIFDSLTLWNPSVDDIEAATVGKVSEQGFTVKLPLKRIAVFCGPASFRFTREAVDWALADETTNILDTALTALIQISGITIRTIRTAVAMHLQPRTLTFMEILNPFVSSTLAALETAPVMTMATVAKWGHRKITIDGSGAIANGVFLKFEREFERATTYAAIAYRLRQDEEELFKILGLEEDRG